MQLEWFSKHTVCKRPCWYLVFIRRFFCCSVYVLRIAAMIIIWMCMVGWLVCYHVVSFEPRGAEIIFQFLTGMNIAIGLHCFFSSVKTSLLQILKLRQGRNSQQKRNILQQCTEKKWLLGTSLSLPDELLYVWSASGPEYQLGEGPLPAVQLKSLLRDCVYPQALTFWKLHDTTTIQQKKYRNQEFIS